MGKLRPFVRKDSYMPNKKWIPFVIGNGYTTTDGASGPAPEYETVTGNPVSFNAITPFPLKQLQIAFSPVQSGTGDPSPENVRPISGWDGVAVWRTGVNVWDGVTESGYIDVNDGTEKSNPDQRRSLFVSCKPSTQYRYVNTNAASGVRIAFYDGAKNYVGMFSNNNSNPQVFTTPANANYLRFYWGDTSGISINYPSTDHDYHAYNPSSTSISLSFGSTVYSGTLDVLTGVVTVDMAEVDLGTLNWLYDSVNTRFYTDGLKGTIKRGTSGWITTLICSNYKSTIGIVADCTISQYATTGYVYIRDTSYTDPATFKTAMSGVTLCYELATPLTIQLTPQEVESLAGDNVLFSDANGDLTVEYRSN